jgi:hypothetical protein
MDASRSVQQFAHEQWPYEPKFKRVNGWRMHYVDEGLDVMSVSRARRFPWRAGARGRSPPSENSARKLNDRSRPELGGPPCVCKIGRGLLG